MAKAIKAKAKIESQTIVSGDCRQAIHWYANWLMEQAALGALTTPGIASARGLFATNFEKDDELLLETTLANLEARHIVPFVISGEDLYKQADAIWPLALQQTKFGQPAVSDWETRIHNCQLLVINNLAPPISAQHLWYLYHYVLYPRALAEKPVFISTPHSFDEFVMFGAGCDDFEYAGRRLTWEKVIALMQATMLNLQQAKLLQAENLPVMLLPEYSLFRAVQERLLNIVPQEKAAQYSLDFAIVDPSNRLKLNIECDFVHQFVKKGEPQRDAQLIKDGWQILHLSYKEITGNLDDCVNLIEELGKGGSKKTIIGRCFNLPMLNYQIKLQVEDSSQLNAIAHARGPAAITGGAGTGKSMCVAQRIAFLVGQGVSPERILVISYSPDTLQMIKLALGKFMAEPLIARVNFYAWQDIGLRILKEHVSAIKRKLPLKVETNVGKILQKLIAKYSKELDQTQLELCGVLDEAAAMHMISLYKANLISPQSAKERATNEREHLLAKVYIAYEDQLQKTNKIDIDDMISMAANILGQEVDLRSYYQNLFEHIIVDEYQDATVACDFLARILAFPNDNLILIGNGDEAIFEHEGAAPQLLSEISIRAPETTCYTLAKNWRCHPQITDHAEQLAQHIAKNRSAKHYIEKKTISGWRDVSSQAIVGPIECTDAKSEANWIADRVQLLAKQGRNLNDVAVICPTRVNRSELADILAQRGLLVESTEHDPNLLPDEAGDVLSFLKLVIDPDGPRAREYFEHICQLRSKPISPKLSSTILSWSESFNLSYLKAVEMYAEVAGDADCVPFDQLIERIRDMHHNKMPPADIIRLLKMPQWLGNYYQSFKIPPGMKYEPLVTITDMEEKSRAYKTTADFVKGYSPPSTVFGENNEAQPALNLLSVNEAKGREFQIAFIPGLVKGALAVDASISEEEKRRMFYVSMTRARELLYLSFSGKIDNKTSVPSPFLYEAGLQAAPPPEAPEVNTPAQPLPEQPEIVEATVVAESAEIIAVEPAVVHLTPDTNEISAAPSAQPEMLDLPVVVPPPEPIKIELPQEEFGGEIIEEFLEPQITKPVSLDETVRKVLQSQPINQCSNCQKSIEKDARFCGHCGAVQTSAQHLCVSCGAILEENEKFCGECGTLA